MNSRQGNPRCSPVRSEIPIDADTAAVVPRRRFLGGIGSCLAVIAADRWVPKRAWAQPSAGAPSSMVAYVGCYTTEKRNGHGKGINVYRMDPASGHWSHVQLVENLVNPSFLALDRRQRFLYAVHGDMTYATAFAGSVASFAALMHWGKLSPVSGDD